MPVSKEKMKHIGIENDIQDLLAFFNQIEFAPGTNNKEAKLEIKEISNEVRNNYEFIYNLRKEKIVASKDNWKEKLIFNLNIYINGTCFRIIDFLISLSSLHKEKNFLASIILLRHFHETICHLFYVLDNTRNFMQKNDFEKFYKLVQTISFQRDALLKPLHINDTLRYFMKKFPMHEKWKYMCDEAYKQASEMAHPSSVGSFEFFGKFYRNNHRFKFKEYQKASVQKSFSYAVVMLENFNFVSNFLQNYLNEYEELYTQMINSDIFDKYNDQMYEFDKEIFDFSKRTS